MTHGTVGLAIRHAGPGELADALVQSRSDTLATVAVFEAALAEPGFTLPHSTEINPPLWELGHIGWFQSHWVARNTQRGLGMDADPDARRGPGLQTNGDALYDSSRVPHAARRSLPLPDADATRAQLGTQLAETLALLRDAAPDDVSLYFWRLVLLHEDMHHEAALYTAQNLGLPIANARWQPAPLPKRREPLVFGASLWRLGHDGPGFVFDNEVGAHELPLAAHDIDSRVVRWDEFLPFVDAAGYAEPRWWSEAGRRWLAASGQHAPRYLRRQRRREGTASSHWQQRRWGHWQPLDPALPACHLSAHEAEAWCAWAGRRLPSEAEWERAAIERTPDFEWGHVWEWTASDFTPYPGFAAHPYRDYSAPWFGSRRVLRGASFGTQPRMQHPRYRNFFPPERNDIFAGFRSCSR